jgi:aryl-alcohol dehydrogenase-like predicted oxidoreductase
MQIRNLGASGLRVSAIGLGCNNFGGRLDLEASRTVIHRALDAGITLFDTADIYGERGGSETVLGKVLGARRQEIVLATKFGGAMDDAGRLKGASRGYIVQAVEASLRRLQTDWIDLYQIHFPDPLTPIEETLRALDDLIHAGKVRYIGCSNLPAWQMVEAQWTARDRRLTPFASGQYEYSLLVRQLEAELLPAMEAYRMGLLPYFPLANGLLTGKYHAGQSAPAGARLATSKGLAARYLTPGNLELSARLEGFAQERGHTLLELAFGWLLSRPQVASVIAGATRPEQVSQNAAAGGWELTAEDRAALAPLLAAS